MFIQLIEGTIADAELWHRQNDRWLAELKPGAKGYLGGTGGVTPDGYSIFMARFDSAESAAANASRPEQGAWWNEMQKAYRDDVVFTDSTDAEIMSGGGSNEAGFVQVVRGRAKDAAAMRSRAKEFEVQLKQVRPDVLGAVQVWHPDGKTFTQFVYFKSEADARRQEQATSGDELRQDFLSMFDGPPQFFDLPSPLLD